MERRGFMDIVNWWSDKLQRGSKNLSPLHHFFDDKDFIETKDEYGDDITIVGTYDGINDKAYGRITNEKSVIFRKRDRALLVVKKIK